MASKRSILTAIVLGGVVAATLDIGAAMLISGAGLTTILQFIASGLIGKAAFDGGTATAVLGAALQEAMGLIIAAVFVSASLAAPQNEPAPEVRTGECGKTGVGCRPP